VNRARDEHPRGAQVYDSEVPGLRLVVGSRSCSWKVVGRVNDGSGRYVSVSLGSSGDLSLKSARQLASEVRLALKRGEDPRVKKDGAEVPTVSEALERYLSERDLRPSTEEWYRRKMAGPLSAVAGKRVDHVSRDDCRTLHRRATERHGSYSANGAMRVLKAVLNDAARHMDLPPNPVARAVRMNRERARDWAVPPEAMADLWRRLDALDDPSKRGAWLLMLTTGLRCGDARGARWDQLDGDGVLTVPSPKGGKARAFRLPLPRLTLEALEAVRAETAPLESPFMFPAPGGGPMRGLRRSEAFPYAPHQMRHTYRTLALEAGVDWQSVLMLMNHSAGHVSFNYVTRGHLTGHLREQQELVAARLASYRP
jgi:integrase